MSNLLKKFLLSFLASLVVLFSFAPFFEAKAAPTDPPAGSGKTTTSSAPSAPQGSWYNQGFGEWYGKVYGSESDPSEIFGERYTAAQVQWVIYSLFSFILNSTTNANVLSCILKNSVDLKACQSMISGLTSAAQPTQAIVPQTEQKSLLSLVFDTNRPFSGIGYFKQRVQKFNLIPTANAAPVVGFGFTALEPVQEMWRASRDIAFGMFVLVAIVFAFMIMFRVKISPQVIISVQSAIPKIVTALILVTFSYAIAGFMIDLMYVVIGIFSLIFAGFLPIHDPNITSGIFNFLTVGQPFGQSVQIGVLGLLYIYLLILPIVFAFLLFSAIGFVLSTILAIIAAAGFAALLTSPANGLILIVGVIIFVILIIILLWQTIKVFWTLLKAFVNILLLTIFAPIQIVAGTFIPNLGFGSWAKSFASNLAVFVVTGVLILSCYIFLWQAVFFGLRGIVDTNFLNSIARMLFGTIIGSISLTPSSAAWPPLLGLGGTSGSQNSATGLLFAGASFVVFTLIPKTAEIIQSFMSGKPFAYGSAIGEAVGVVRTVGVGALAYHVGNTEEAAMEASRLPGAQPYSPKVSTQVLRTLGIIKK